MSAERGDIARARSALEAAQSELHTIQLKLAPLRMQEQRALGVLADAARRLRTLEGWDAVKAGGEQTRALVELARLYEGVPCDVEPQS